MAGWAMCYTYRFCTKYAQISWDKMAGTPTRKEIDKMTIIPGAQDPEGKYFLMPRELLER
jgi:hypothetical protein